MKLLEIYEELLELCQRLGVKIRKDKGSFTGGYCILKEEPVIVFNRSTTLETKTALLARCLAFMPVDDIFVKPLIREFIEKEKAAQGAQTDHIIQVLN